MQPDIAAYNAGLDPDDREVADLLAAAIAEHLPEAEGKVWHRHPVWFLDGNPVVGYVKQKGGMRLTFWSGQGFTEPGLAPTGSFKAGVLSYTSADQIDLAQVARWLAEARDVQWDYKNIAKRKGVLERLR